jgi:hypothetical protein
MRITKRQLKRIIKEERAKLIRENQSREATEGKLLGELMGLIGDLTNIEKELYGLVDPEGADMGSVYGEELNATIDELDALLEKLTNHFDSLDLGSGQGNSVTDPRGQPGFKPISHPDDL